VGADRDGRQPFVSQPDYTGPLVARLGGADISWVVGWIVPAAVYLLLARAVRAPAAEGSAQA
jgi:nucleobase:cation symporter-1, NCS1 family